ncbi:PLEC protein, partial [Polyodon spathula]|nr:PLEC protein [Polyodon spathula]
MLMPLEKLRAIYELLFRDGVLVAKKDKRPQSLHPEVPEVTNLQVIRAMGSLKSRGYVRETFAWRHFYWYLTNEGIVYLRDYLRLPPEIVPSSLQRVRRPASTLDVARKTAGVQVVEGPTSYAPKSSSRAGAEGLDSLMDRQGYRRKKVAMEEEESKTQVSTVRASQPPRELYTSKPASAAEGSSSFMGRQSNHREKTVVVQEMLQTKKVSAGRGSHMAPETPTPKPAGPGTQDRAPLVDRQGGRKEVTATHEKITVHNSSGAVTKKASSVSVSQEAPKLHANKQSSRASAEIPAPNLDRQETLKKEAKGVEEEIKVQKSSVKYSHSSLELDTTKPSLEASVEAPAPVLDSQEPLKKEANVAEKNIKAQKGSLKKSQSPPEPVTPKLSSGAGAESLASILEGHEPPKKDVKVEEENIKIQKSSLKASQPPPKLDSSKSVSTETPVPALDQEPLEKEVKIAVEKIKTQKSSVKGSQPKSVTPMPSSGVEVLDSILVQNDMMVVEENILIQNVTIMKNKEVFAKTESQETTELYTAKPKSGCGAEPLSAITEEKKIVVEEKIQVSAVTEAQQAPEQCASKPSLGAGTEVPGSSSHHQEQEVTVMEDAQKITALEGSENNLDPVEGL